MFSAPALAELLSFRGYDATTLMMDRSQVGIYRWNECQLDHSIISFPRYVSHCREEDIATDPMLTEGDMAMHYRERQWVYKKW
jgi:hypothetical protein